jgi:hypothetical protein
MRRIFFFALSAVLISAIFTQIFGGSTVAFGVLLVAASVATFATMVDSIQGKRAYNEQVRDLEADTILRVHAAEGDEGLAKMGSVFSPLENKMMRRKRREHNYTILIKFIFLVIFVVLFINLF